MPGPGALLASTSQTNDVAAVMAAAADTLRAWVGLGPAFFASADPATGAFSGTFAFDIPDAAAAAFYAIELSGLDVVRFASLADAAVPIESLFAATDGRPERSVRWREVISDLGWGDELRAAIRCQGTVWGYLCLHRETAERPFSDKDAARLANVLPVLAGALRRTALAAAPDGSRLDTGVILLDEHGRMVGSTGGAAAWLDELGPPGPDGLPLLVAGLVQHVLVSGRTATSALTTRAGRSGFLEAAILDGASTPQVAVVISAASPMRRLDQLAAASGLTPREVQVVERVVSGHSTKVIAAELGISPYTVQAHLTSVFTKTGHRSRRDLLNRLRR
jgi:DNA-binding CsgD family transcriptional regulator